MLDKTDIKKLFAVLQARYGHKWTTAYDDPEIMAIAINEWHRELQGFRPEDIRVGLTRWAEMWPPTLPEFSRACLPAPEAFGLDLRAEVERRLPRYKYVAENAHEEARRSKQFDQVVLEVREELTTDMLEQIRVKGIEKQLVALPDTETPKRLDS